MPNRPWYLQGLANQLMPDVSGDTPPDFGATNPAPAVDWGDFTPQQPSRYDGWELTNRPAMLPFLGEYTNTATGEKSGGMAWPSMVTEPVQAAQRFIGDGGMWDVENPDNARDGNTLLWSMYGGNALNPAAALPKGAVGMFAGRKAATADLNALARAEKAAAEGASRDAIWNETGWFQGPDKQWRFEIDDSGMGLTGRRAGVLGDVVDHKPLYDAYPATRDVPTISSISDSIGGMHNVDGISVSAPDRGLLKEVFGHEIQHRIQREEDFARGGNPTGFAPEAIQAERDRLLSRSFSGNPIDEAIYAPMARRVSGPDMYHRLAGEVESRAVEERLRLTPEERRARPPWLDYDVPDEDQIVRMLSEGPQLSGRPSLLGSAIAGAQAERPGITAYHGSPHGTGAAVAGAKNVKGARPEPSALQPKAEAMGASLAEANSLPQSAWNGNHPYDRAEQLAGLLKERIPSVAGRFDVVRSGSAAGDSAYVKTPAGTMRISDHFAYPKADVAWSDFGNNADNFRPDQLVDWVRNGMNKTTRKVLESGNKNQRPSWMNKDEWDSFKADPFLYSDTGRPSIFGAAAASAGEQPKGITAYHGSPHDFDKFSLDKIGSGEGAQAYGHGLYFAENEGVAKQYRDQLGGLSSFLRYDGEPWDYTNPRHVAANEVQNAGSILGAIHSIKSQLHHYRSGSDQQRRMADALSILERGDEIPKRDAGHMYQVRINADPNDFLDWDKTIKDQPRSIQKLMRSVGSDTGESLNDLSAGDWLTTYRSSGMADETSETVESMLRRRGIPGIRYLDAMSRGAGDGTSNYVVFDDSLIEILKKYGWIPPAAYGLDAMSGEDSKPTY